MDDATMPPLTFRRGVNIEGWLGCPDRPSEKRPLFFGPADAEVLAELGFDHIRINVNEQHLWDDSDKPVRSSFDRVDELLKILLRKTRQTGVTNARRKPYKFIRQQKGATRVL